MTPQVKSSDPILALNQQVERRIVQPTPSPPQLHKRCNSMIVNTEDYSHFMDMEQPGNAFYGATSELNHDNYVEPISPRQAPANSRSLIGQLPPMDVELFAGGIPGSFKTSLASALAAFEKEEVMPTVTQ